jgi:hypothetical protein
MNSLFRLDFYDLRISRGGNLLCVLGARQPLRMLAAVWLIGTIDENAKSLYHISPQ